MQDLRAKGNPVAYVGDVGRHWSLRKSATNSVLWVTGEDIPSGCPTSASAACLRRPDLQHQSTPSLRPSNRRVEDEMATPSSCVPTTARCSAPAGRYEFAVGRDFRRGRAGGRIPDRRSRPHRHVCEALGLPPTCPPPQNPAGASKAGFTLAQKMVGRACGLPGGAGRAPGHLLRADDDHRRLARTPPAR